MRAKHLAIILVSLVLAVPASPTHSEGVVTICDEAHLRTALIGGGMVTFACSGSIRLTAEVVIAADTAIDGSGQSVTISGNDQVRVFSVDSGVPLSLNWLTIANGRSSYHGGAIYNNGILYVSNSTFSSNYSYQGAIENTGTLTMSNSTFSGNSASSAGGGIYSSGTLTVSNSTFFDNSAYAGGAIYNYGTLTVSDSSFFDNSAIGHGGGIRSDSTLTVSNSTFSDNSAGGGDGGGGISALLGTVVTVSNSTFSGNSAGWGGGIFFVGDELTVSNSTFSGNSAGNGGGIYSGSTMTVANSTFSGNTGADWGGGIVFGGDELTVSNSTFSGNSAGSGGGCIANGTGVARIENTIVANSLAGGNCSGTILDGGGNLSYPDTTCPGINRNPKLGPLQDNGGPTETMALGPGSAAIEAGNDAICAAAPVDGFDQRSVTRPQGLHCDIGAVEQECPSFVPPGTVGVEHIMAVATRWSWTNSTPGWDPAYDLNGDNKINIVDIMLLTRMWGGTCSWLRSNH